jgi:acetyl esterase/lipase
MMNDIAGFLSGRLGNPDMTILDDPRTDPRIVKALAAFGSFDQGVEPLGLDATYEQCLDYCDAFEEVGSAAHPLLLANMPVFESVVASSETIEGVDGNPIKLLIHRPVNIEGPIPCVVHLHGGGMVIASAEDPSYIRWRGTLADCGMIVIGVEFRNGGGRLGRHPFPAGLNDCASAVLWANENRTSLGISNIIVSGESGGGNLSLATALKAKQEGWLDAIDGVYGMCPYISGLYSTPPVQLLSLRENDGYMLDCGMMTSLARVYDPSNENGTNPLAWPFHARKSDLEGLPPHAISVNELDPLRDEGLAYYRKLLAAGVDCIGRTVHGTPHGGDMGFPDVIPDVYQETARSIYGFAKSVGES